MITLKNLESNQIPLLFKFYQDTYPERSNQLEEYIYRITRLPFRSEDISLNTMVVDGDKIVASNMIIPFEINIEDQGIKTFFWGYDTVVAEEYQKTDAGVLMLGTALSKKWWIGIGFSEIAINLHKRIKSNFLGGKKRFVYVNFFSLVYFRIFLRFFKIVRTEGRLSNKFSKNIQLKGNSFVRIDNPTDLNIPLRGIWNPDIIEPLRDQGYLIRRFFQFPKSYVFYQSLKPNKRGNHCYFVVCPIIYKNTKLLFVVDFRSDVSNIEEVKQIAQAGKKLVNRSKFDALIFDTSVAGFEKVLRRIGYFHVSTAEIATNYKKISSKNIVNFTSADSDGDFHLRSL